MNVSWPGVLACGHSDTGRCALSCSSPRDQIQVRVFSQRLGAQLLTKLRAVVLWWPGSVCEKLTVNTQVLAEHITLKRSICTQWLLSFSLFWKLKISSDSSMEKNKLSSCIYTEEKIFLIVFAIPSHAMTPFS